jgi:hypothetical protein
MPTMSVITPVGPGLHEHLPDPHESLLAQELPPGWSWEWLLQCDSMDPGDRAMIRAVLPADEPRLSLGAVRSGGPAIARTVTLGRATGDLAKALRCQRPAHPGHPRQGYPCTAPAGRPLVRQSRDGRAADRRAAPLLHEEASRWPHHLRPRHSSAGCPSTAPGSSTRPPYVSG